MIFFSIFNSNYFIRKVKLIYGKLLLVEYKVIHKKKIQKICISVTHTHLVINMCTLLKGKQSLNDTQS